MTEPNIFKNNKIHVYYSKKNLTTLKEKYSIKFNMSPGINLF